MATQTTTYHEQTAGRGTRIAATVARLLLGLAFFVFGLNGFLNFIPQPKTAMPPLAAQFGETMMKTYLLHLVAGTQAVCGALLLAGVFVPLALVVLAPVIVNIICFHVFLAPQGIAPGLIVLLLELYLAWVYRDHFRSVLALRARPR